MLERRHANPSSKVELPAHRARGPLVCITFKYQKRPRAYGAGRQPPAWPTLPRWLPPRGSLSCDSFTETKPSCLGQPLPAFRYYSNSPREKSVRQLKAFLWRCYRISQGVPETLGQKRAMCVPVCACVCAYTHPCGGLFRSPPSMGPSGSRAISRPGDVVFMNLGAECVSGLHFSLRRC